LVGFQRFISTMLHASAVFATAGQSAEEGRNDKKYPIESKEGGKRMGQSESTIPMLSVAEAFNTGIILQLTGMRRTNECSTCRIYLTNSCQRCSRCGSPKNSPCLHCYFELGRPDYSDPPRAVSIKRHQIVQTGS